MTILRVMTNIFLKDGLRFNCCWVATVLQIMIYLIVGGYNLIVGCYNWCGMDFTNGKLLEYKFKFQSYSNQSVFVTQK